MITCVCLFIHVYAYLYLHKYIVCVCVQAYVQRFMCLLVITIMQSVGMLSLQMKCQHLAALQNPEVICWPLMFGVFSFRSEGTHSANTISHNLRKHSHCMFHLWLPVINRCNLCAKMYRGQRCHIDFSGCGSKQTLFLTFCLLTVNTSELELHVLGVMSWTH